MQNYPTADIAYERFASKVHRLFPSVGSPVPQHNMKHRLIRTEYFDFYLIFKRDFYKTFQNEFYEFTNKYPEFKGVGESINKEVLDKLCLRDPERTILVFIYEDAKAYVVYPNLFKNFAEKNNLIRKQDALNTYKSNGTVNIIQEITYSIPVHESFLINFDRWIENLKN